MNKSNDISDELSNANFQIENLIEEEDNLKKQLNDMSNTISELNDQIKAEKKHKNVAEHTLHIALKDNKELEEMLEKANKTLNMKLLDGKKIILWFKKKLKEEKLVKEESIKRLEAANHRINNLLEQVSNLKRNELKMSNIIKEESEKSVKIIQELKAQKVPHKESNTQNENLVKELRNKISILEEEVAEGQAVNQTLEQVLDDKEAKIGNLNRKLNDLEQEVNDYKETETNLKSKIEIKNKRIEALEKLLTLIKSNINTMIGEDRAGAFQVMPLTRLDEVTNLQIKYFLFK